MNIIAGTTRIIYTIALLVAMMVTPAAADLEFGDAPDPTYPSLLASDGARHIPTETECLGLALTTPPDWKDFEPNANIVDQDPLDDGLLTFALATNNPAQTVDFEVTNFMDGELIVNILVDLNGDGDWNDMVGSQSEHVVQNQIINLPAGTDAVFTSTPFSTVGATPVSTWMRITLTRSLINPGWDGTMASAGYVNDPFGCGETEDWGVYIEEYIDDLEFGDALDPFYPSLLASDGARHFPTDTECFGLQSTGDWKDFEPNARITDLDTPYDDGLLTFALTANNPAQTVSFEVTNTIAQNDLLVNILVDLNQNGVWDPGEHVVQNQAINLPGPAEGVFVSTPFSTVGATLGPTWMRITLTRSPINPGWDGTMSGFAQMIPFEYGETEDWRVNISEEEYLEFGDALDPFYPSLLASDGARHFPTDTECLGLQSTGDWKDFEPNARITDLDIPYDDGLLTFALTANNPAQTVSFEVTNTIAQNDLLVNILVDLNQNGVWDLGEHVVQNQAINLPGPAEGVFVSTPFSTVGATPGPTWMRITLTRSLINPGWDGTMSGFAQMIPFEYGETEDWRVNISEEVLEFGDAPDDPLNNYPSLLASDGARHFPTDTECLGLQSTSDWKDFELNANVPDLDLFDDGLLTSALSAGNPAQTVSFEVTNTIPQNDLLVTILLDLNQDGDWNDVVSGQSEHVVQNQAINLPGPAEMVFTSMSFSTVGATPGPTWMRVTLTRSPINPGWDGTMSGFAQMIPFEYGETEDWRVTIAEEELLEFGDAPDPTYPSLLASNGARHIQTSTECLGLAITTPLDWKDFEPNANVVDLDIFDDGLQTFALVVNKSSQTVDFEVTNMIVQNDLLVNILVDLNQNGVWDPGEHVVQNQAINLAGPADAVFTSMPFSTVGAVPGPTWMRITLTRSLINPGWDGTMASAGYFWNPFEYGETEDWVVEIVPAGICGDANDDGVVDMTDVMTVWYDFADYPTPGAYTISNMWAADVNCDGVVDMTDVMTIWYDFADYPTPGAYVVNCC